MQGRMYCKTFHFHGTLSANGAGRFTVPRRSVLSRIQFSCSSATAATLDFGPASDPDGMFDGVAVGQSDAVEIHDKSTANGVLYTDADDLTEIVLEPDVVYEFTLIHASAQNATLEFEIIE